MKQNSKEKQYYYSLRLLGDTPYYRSGDLFRGSGEPLLIGETADCDVRYGRADERYAPEQYAAILPDEDGRSWRIVRLSPYVDVEVTGYGRVNTVCRLNSGDRISFGEGGAVLQFREHHDESFHDTGRIIVSRPDNRVAIGLFAFLAVAVVTLGLGLYFSMKGIKKADLEEYEKWVYIMKVDSVDCIMRVKGERDSLLWRETFADGHNPIGTAFLTTDSLLLTARHCVEPWVGEDQYLETGLSVLDETSLLRRVAEAYTWNYTHTGSDTTYVLASHCTVSNEDGTQFMVNSSADSVTIDRRRERIVTIDDFDNIYYMPTLVPMFNDRSMELGDIVKVHTDRAGGIATASEADMELLGKSPEAGLLGYPETGFDKRSLDFSAGTVQSAMTREGSGMIVLKMNATHGFSGGPVFIDGNGGYVVVGVLSKVDHVNPEIKYAVPVTETVLKK